MINTIFPFWHKKQSDAKTTDYKKFKLSMSFYSPDGNALSMPLACLSAYVKKHRPNTQITMAEINITLNSEEHTVDGFIQRVMSQQPDLIAFSCMSPHWISLDPYLQALKKSLPKLPILIGGYQAILAPEETLAHPCVDYICVGDGEEPLVQLIQHLSGESSSIINGLWMKTPDGKIIKSSPILTEDFSNLPFPDYSIYEQNGSLRGLGLSIFGPQNLFVLPVMTGRGCPYRCTYCCNTPLLEKYRGNGTYLRKYNPEHLVEELCRLKELYRVDYFEFWDELFLSNMKFAMTFLELYRKQVCLPFSINSRVEKMDEKFCYKARDAGCHTIWFGIESGSEKYRQQFLGRKMTNAQILGAAENARKAGIRRLTFNIVGMPFETKENMLETLTLNQVIKPEFFFFFPYIPLRGTPLYEVVFKANLLIEQVAGDYQEGLREGVFKLNIKEHDTGISSIGFQEVCIAMKNFQLENNRLDLNGL
jgi:anaerobic magnesium-protoporphyrin IX monomethyl ester cyclase